MTVCVYVSVCVTFGGALCAFFVLSRIVLALGRAADRVVGRVATFQHPQEAPDGEDRPAVAVKDALVERVPQRLPVVYHLYCRGR